MLKSAPSGWRMLPSKASFELKGYGSEAALNLAAFLSHRSEMGHCLQLRILAARPCSNLLPVVAPSLSP